MADISHFRFSVGAVFLFLSLDPNFIDIGPIKLKSCMKLLQPLSSLYSKEYLLRFAFFGFYELCEGILTVFWQWLF